MRRHAFTLIELLVVVTIIVVLLALLTPALDKAIYQAELVACQAGLDAFGSSLLSGCVENQRRYPDRVVRGAPVGVNHNTPPDWGAPAGDDRPRLRDYLKTRLDRLLNDPLAEAIELDAAPSSVNVQTSYALWYDWSTGPAERIARKIGDAWTSKGQSFNVIAQDYLASPGETYYLSSHPDRDGVMYNYVDRDSSTGAASNGTAILPDEIISTWLAQTRSFGLLDFSALMSDGAVVRYVDVKRYDEDERMTSVPYLYNVDVAPTYWFQVPRR